MIESKGWKKMHNKCDVLIIGAGPAGLMAARKAVGKGFSVLVLEKEQDLGKKPCAEAISESDFGVAEIPASTQFITNNIEEALIFPQDESQSTRISGKGYILNKALFLYALASKAVSGGAEIFMDHEVLQIVLEDGKAVAVKYKHKGQVSQTSFKILIGADGATSITLRNCGFDQTNYNTIPAVQYHMVNCNIKENRMIRLYFGNDVAPKGYAWIFPKTEYSANVGIGVQGFPAKPYLDKFIRNHPIIFGNASIIKEAGGLVPVGGQVQPVKENVMLCGDSATQVVPVTGAGIGTSMIAGSVAGETAALALEANDFSLLNEYPKKYARLESRIHGDFNMLSGLISF